MTGHDKTQSVLRAALLVATGFVGGLVAGIYVSHRNSPASAHPLPIAAATPPVATATSGGHVTPFAPGSVDIAIVAMRLAEPGNPSKGTLVDLSLDAPPAAFELSLAGKKLAETDYRRLPASGSEVRLRILVSEKFAESRLGNVPVELLEPGTGRTLGSRDIHIPDSLLRASAPLTYEEPAKADTEQSPAGPADYSSLSARARTLAQSLTECLQPKLKGIDKVVDVPACAASLKAQSPLLREIAALPSPPGPFPRISKMLKDLAVDKAAREEVIELSAELWGVSDRLTRPAAAPR
jgi:hypothetical protein